MNRTILRRGALSALLNDKMSRKYAGYFYDSGDDFGFDAVGAVRV